MQGEQNKEFSQRAEGLEGMGTGLLRGQSLGRKREDKKGKKQIKQIQMSRRKDEEGDPDKDSF